MRIRLIDPVMSLTHKRRLVYARSKRKRVYLFDGTPHALGQIGNPLGIGGLQKGSPSRNPTGKGGFQKGSAKSRAAIMKSVLIRSGRLDKSMSKRHVRKEKAKSIALEARELQELAKKSMAEAMKRINEIVTNRSSQDHHAIAATVFLADRAYGKALQPNLNAGADNNGNPSEIDDTELNKRIADALDRVARITGGAAKKVKGKK